MNPLHPTSTPLILPSPLTRVGCRRVSIFISFVFLNGTPLLTLRNLYYVTCSICDSFVS